MWKWKIIWWYLFTLYKIYDFLYLQKEYEKWVQIIIINLENDPVTRSNSNISYPNKNRLKSCMIKMDLIDDIYAYIVQIYQIWTVRHLEVWYWRILFIC
jgi:hypothetical protein